MNLRHLRFFVVLAEELSFTRAAERLNVAQPALSHQIRNVEELIGVRLIDRSSRPLQLTAAGDYFFLEARRLLAEHESAATGARQIASGKRGWLGIGFTRSAMYSVLPPALKAFHRTQPDIELKLFEMLTEEQVDALKIGKIHVGIGRNVQTMPGYSNTVLLREPVLIVLPSDSPALKKGKAKLADVAYLPLILYPKHPTAEYPRFIETIYRDAGFVPPVAHRVYKMQTALALVAAGLGITFVGKSVASHGRSDVIYRGLHSVGSNNLTSLTATSRSDDENPALQRFLRTLASLEPTRGR